MRLWALAFCPCETKKHIHVGLWNKLFIKELKGVVPNHTENMALLAQKNDRTSSPKAQQLSITHSLKARAAKQEDFKYQQALVPWKGITYSSILYCQDNVCIPTFLLFAPLSKDPSHRQRSGKQQQYQQPPKASHVNVKYYLWTRANTDRQTYERKDEREQSFI